MKLADMITTACDFPVVIVMIGPIVQYLAIRTSNIYWDGV